MHAAMFGKYEAASLFMASAEKQDINGDTALMHACRAGYEEIALLLAPLECRMRNYAGNTALHISAAQGNAPLCTLLAHSESGLLNAQGSTALIIASARGFLPCVQALVPYEAKFVDKNGWTALMHAVSNVDTDINAMLMDVERADRTAKSSAYCEVVWNKVESVDSRRMLALCQFLVPFEAQCCTGSLLRLLKDTCQGSLYGFVREFLCGEENTLTKRILELEAESDRITADAFAIFSDRHLETPL